MGDPESHNNSRSGRSVSMDSMADTEPSSYKTESESSYYSLAPDDKTQSTSSEQSESPDDQSNSKWCSGLRMLSKVKCYHLYVFLILLLTYTLDQIARYLVAIVTRRMSVDIHYGDQVCMLNTSGVSQHRDVDCDSFSQKVCLASTHPNFSSCQWQYNGEGYQYQAIAGPIFSVAYTLTGVPLAFAADRYNRKLLLCACLAFWSAMTLLTSFVEEYWQFAILRVGVGIGVAGCSPLAISVMSDYFEPDVRPSAAGLYNWVVFLGYSMSYVLGDLLQTSLSWRWAFGICGVAGLLLALLALLTVREPERHIQKYDPSDYIYDFLEDVDDVRWYHQLGVLLKFSMTPTIILLCLAGCARHAAGYIWAYNTQPYFEAIGQSPLQIVSYMSWVPLIGGTTCVLLAALVADKLLKRIGALVKILVLIISQLVAAPFFALALYVSPPYAYITMIPGYMLGESWISIVIALLLELVPAPLRTGVITVYMFTITIIGGCMPMLVPLLQSHYENTGLNPVDALRVSLYILSPGLFILAAVIFTLALFVMKRDIQVAKRWHYDAMM